MTDTTRSASRPASRRLWIAGSALTAVAAVVTAAFIVQASSAGAAPAAAPQAPTVSVAQVVQSDVATWAEFSGRLEAVERVDIRSRVAGTVQSVHFREGSLVGKGDLLITIDPAPSAADVERAEAQVVAAEARVSYTRSESGRARRLLDEHAIAQREVDERANAEREAEAALRGAQAALQTARLTLGYTQVRAPVAGRVGKVEITVGNLVAAGAGAPVLTTLVSVSPIYASFDADEQTVASALHDVQALGKAGAARPPLERIPVQMGTAATSDTLFAGRLQWLDNQVDAKSGTVRARAVFDNADGSLMPGQFARLRLGAVGTSPALLINERAVGTDQSKKYVMVVGADNTARYREVTLGANVNGLRIATSGLTAQDRIIVNGLQRVRPGAVVAPEPVAMDPKVDAGRADAAATPGASTGQTGSATPSAAGGTSPTTTAAKS